MASRKIPPHVARELKRHLGNGGGVAKQRTSSNKSNHAVLIGCIAVVSLAASFPYLSTKWIRNLSERDEELKPSQIRRGAFNNSGSKDAGKDPQWDWKKGLYKRDEELAKMIEEEDPNQIEHGDDWVKKGR